MTPDAVPGAALDAPVTGELTLVGRVMPASNATFVGEIDGVRVVYKPVAGERPLWDFPDGTLAAREVAAHLLSRASGWDVVPPTWYGTGPHGPGMLQLWQEPDPGVSAVDVVPRGEVPPGFLAVFEGVGAGDVPVTLVHEDSAPLRRMALFDVVTNNADRKGGHVLGTADGRRLGVDHGLTFHVEPKLRTVLWGWAGEPLLVEELEDLRALRAQLAGDLGVVLAELLTADEVAATRERVDRLLRIPLLPLPGEDWPSIPWPPF